MFGSRNFLFAKSGGGATLYRLFSWGQNNFGQLGLGNTANRSSPVQVGSLTDWGTLQTAGRQSIFVITTGNKLYAWGRNFSGMLGLGDTANRSSPVQVGSLTNWQSISSSLYHTLAIKTDGTLWSWGYGNDGRLGLGNTTSYSSPKQIGALTDWSKINVNADTSFAITTTGNLWVWGNGASGSLGLGNTTSYSSPKQVGTGWSNVSVSRQAASSTLAVKTNGTLFSWGSNNYGQLGLGNTTNYSSPKQIGALTDWSDISVGRRFCIAKKTNGTIWSWGQNNVGKLGQGNTANRSSPTQIGSLTNWSKINAGYYQTGAIKTDGTLWAWGSGAYGALGDGTTINKSSPVQVGSSTTWTNVNANYYNMVAIEAEATAAPVNLTLPIVSGTAEQGQTLSSTTGTWGQVPSSFAYQWQRGTSNIVGATSSTYVIQSADIGSTLRCVVTATNAIGAASANSANTATVIAFPGKLFVWGTNTYGRLGLGNTTNYSSPVQVGALTDWITPTNSRENEKSWSLCLKNDGTLWSWGNNQSGTLGLNGGPPLRSSSPVQIGSLTDWSIPTSGYSSGQCIKTDGTLWSWGSNTLGQLGLNDYPLRSSPVQVGSSTTWSAVSAGRQSVLAVDNGKLFAWGANGYGQLGLGDTVNRSSPVQVGALTTWAKPSASANINSETQQFSFCTKTDGTLWAWGRNNRGQLGQNNTINRSSPVQIGSLTNWATPSAGGQDWVLCTKTDGTLWSWGYNVSGQLGHGNQTNYSSPKQVGALTDWAIPSAGRAIAGCIKTDGTLWTWGYNNGGMLGQGDSTAAKLSPIQVGALTTWTKVAMGQSMGQAVRK